MILLVLIVDSLDEAKSHRAGGANEMSALKVLREAWRERERWPAWLRLVVTCRSDAGILDTFQPAPPRRDAGKSVKGAKGSRGASTKGRGAASPKKQQLIEVVAFAGGAKQLEAIESYARSRLAAASRGNELEWLVPRLPEKSKGVFRWAETGRKSLLELPVEELEQALEEVPEDLHDMYHWYVDREFGDEGVTGESRALVQVLLAAHELGRPLLQKDLEAAAWLLEPALLDTSHKVKIHLARLAQFFPAKGSVVHMREVYHPSFAEWLLQSGGFGHEDVGRGSKGLAAACLLGFSVKVNKMHTRARH